MSTEVEREELHAKRDAACAALDLDVENLIHRMKLIGWPPSKLHEEMTADGWEDRFRSAVTLASERDASRKVWNVLERGPQQLALKPWEELLVLISDPKLRAFAEQYRPSEHGGRLLIAPTGVGKSASCVALLRRLMLDEVLAVRTRRELNWHYADFLTETRFMWVRAFDLPNARLGHKFGAGEADLVEQCCSAKFLILDDLGWESRRAGAEDVIMEVLAARYDQGLFTCATTGMQLNEFVERYGEAVLRRIVETRGAEGKVLDLWPRKS